MKKKTTILLVGILCAASMAAGVTAAEMIQKVQAELRQDFSIVIDGKKQNFKNVNGEEVYPLLYDGTTYLPVRAIGELMGKTVYWYEDDKRIELKNDGSTVTDADIIVPGDGDSKNEITLAKAKELALNKAKLDLDKAEFTKAKLDSDDGVRKYELEFRSDGVKYFADIKASDGTFLLWEIDDDNSKNNQNISEHNITIEEAKKIALKKANLTENEVKFAKEKTDIDDGIRLYELKFIYGQIKYSAEIRASDGAVLSWEVEDNTPNKNKDTEDIGIEKAKEIALNKAGLSGEDVKFTKTKAEEDDGRRVYEIEFRYNGIEYSAEILASNGAILEWEAEK